MAVYTEVSDEELEQFLAAYELGAVLSFKGIAEGVENSNFFLHAEAGYFILTLYEKRVSEQDLPFFLGLMQHLAARGVTCPQPVVNRQGSALGRVAGRPAVIVTFLDGLALRRPEARHCAMLGEGLARLHRASADFALERKNALSLASWRPLFERARARADTVQDGLADTIAAELDFLESAWPGDLPSGIIHADLFPDNAFFLEGRLSGIIDFYFACKDFFAYDLAVCLNAWCFELDGSFNVTKGMALLNAYTATGRLDRAEIEAMPILARGSALRFLLTRLVDWLDVPPGALVKPKDPIEYAKKLHFHQHATSVRDYGLMR